MAITVKHPFGNKKKYSFEMTGTKKVMNNLNKAIAEIEDRTKRGVMRAALLLRRNAIELTPMDTGNLRESYFVVWTGGTIGAGRSPHFKTGGSRGVTEKEVAIMQKHHNKTLDMATKEYESTKSIVANVSCSAFYALFVHEIKQSHAVGQWKFLETAAKQSKKGMLQIIQQEVDLKGTPGRSPE